MQFWYKQGRSINESKRKWDSCCLQQMYVGRVQKIIQMMMKLSNNSKQKAVRQNID
jgi:hypothetical protein